MIRRSSRRRPARLGPLFGATCAAVLALTACGEPPRPDDAPAPRAGLATQAPGVPTTGAGTAAGAPPAAQTQAPTALQGATPPPAADDRLTRVRALLGRTLNTTAGDLARFEGAPHYQLTLDFDAGLMAYDGSSRLTLTPRAGGERLVFLLYPNSPELVHAGTQNLSVSEVRVAGRPVQPTFDGPLMTVPLPAGVANGGPLTVEMRFRGVLFRLPEGAADAERVALDQLLKMVVGGEHEKGGFGVFSYGDRVASLGLWYPILANFSEEGGWDTRPGAAVGDVSFFDVANYELEVTAPWDMTVITTGVTAGRQAEGDRQRVRVEAGAVRELAVQMSREYASTSTVVDGVKVTSWYLPEHADAGRRVLEHARDALREFGQAFGPYPYTELDVVEAPLVGGAAGVEFPGLVTIGKMLYGPPALVPGSAPPGVDVGSLLGDTLEFVVAHEVAHEWWNAVVGSDSKRHPFLDEALANHSAVLYFDRKYGPEAARKQRAMQLELPYHMARMAGAQDRRVDLPTDAFDDLNEYAAIVYGKGGLFFEHMRQRLGDERWLTFLRDYYRRHAFGLATPASLVDAMAAASSDPADVRARADRWLKQAFGDLDIGPPDATALLRTLVEGADLGPDGQRLVELLDHRGMKELQRMLDPSAALDPGAPGPDLGAVIELSARLLEGDDPELARLLGATGRVMSRVQAGDDDPRALIKDIGRELTRDDPELRAWLEAADLLLKLAE